VFPGRKVGDARDISRTQKYSSENTLERDEGMGRSGNLRRLVDKSVANAVEGGARNSRAGRSSAESIGFVGMKVAPTEKKEGHKEEEEVTKDLVSEV